MSDVSTTQDKNYQAVSRAIVYIRRHARRQPSLAEVAAEVNLSESHFQRIFSEWAGISPKRFLQFLTKEYARQALKESADILSTSLDAGLSGAGRLHDLMITCEAMTPGEVKAQGQGVTVHYGVTSTPFGLALLAWTSRGVCKLAFGEYDSPDSGNDFLLDELALEWPCATLLRDDVAADKLSKRIFHPKSHKAGQAPQKLHLLLRGTNFQIKVWEALMNIGSSRVVSYSTLARLAGLPKAQRAVGSALAANRIAYLIPCHRVIRESGDVGVYHWGSERKAMMLAWEQAIEGASDARSAAEQSVLSRRQMKT